MSYMSEATSSGPSCIYIIRQLESRTLATREYKYYTHRILMYANRLVDKGVANEIFMPVLVLIEWPR